MYVVRMALGGMVSEARYNTLASARRQIRGAERAGMAVWIFPEGARPTKFIG